MTVKVMLVTRCNILALDCIYSSVGALVLSKHHKLYCMYTSLHFKSLFLVRENCIYICNCIYPFCQGRLQAVAGVGPLDNSLEPLTPFILRVTEPGTEFFFRKAFCRLCIIVWVMVSCSHRPFFYVQ